MKIENYKELMAIGHDNAKYPLEHPLKSIELEIKKGIEGHSIDTNYIKGKILMLKNWIEYTEKRQDLLNQGLIKKRS